jgi:hypothetical protein
MFKSPSLRRIVPLVFALAGAAAAGSAQAGGVHWSIGINLPGPPVVYAPPPAVVYAPPPAVYYEPRPVRYYNPPPAAYYYGRPVRGSEWCPPQRGWRGDERWEGRRYRY